MMADASIAESEGTVVLPMHLQIVHDEVVLIKAFLMNENFAVLLTWAARN